MVLFASLTLTDKWYRVLLTRYHTVDYRACVVSLRKKSPNV